MNYLLDTCVLAEFKNKKPEQKVLEWLDDQLEETLFLSVITIGEIQKGISALTASTRRRRELEKWLQSLIYRYDGRIVPMDIDVMIDWGELNSKLAKKGRVFPFLDSLIASTARTHKLTLITRNESDFKDTGVKILNIWK